MSGGVDQTSGTASTSGSGDSGGGVTFNNDGQLVSSSDPTKFVNFLGEELPDGKGPLSLNKEGFLSDAKGNIVNDKGEPLIDASGQRIVGSDGKPLAQGEAIQQAADGTLQRTPPPEKGVIDTVGSADGTGTNTGSLDSKPILSPVGATSGSGEELLAELSRIGDGSVIQEARELFYSQGYIEIGETKLALSELLPNKETEALMQFINREIYKTDGQGNLLLDQNGQPIKMNLDEFLNHLAASPALLAEEIFNGKTVKDYMQSMQIVAAVYLNEFLDVIMNFLIMIKRTLNALAQATQGQLKQRYEMHMATLGDLNDAIDELGDMVEESYKNFLEQKEAAAKAKQCFVVNVVVTCVLAVVSVILTVVSAGALAAPLAVAMIAFSVVMAGLSIADAATGGKIMGAAMAALSEAFATVFGGLVYLICMGQVDWDTCKAVGAILGIVAVIAVTIVLMVVTKGSGSGISTATCSTLAPGVAKEVAQQMIAGFVRMMVMQLMMFISNTIGESMKIFIENAGVDEKTAEILGYVAMALTLAVCAVAMVGAYQGGKDMFGAAREVGESGMSQTQATFMHNLQRAAVVMNTLGQVTQAGSSIAEGIFQIQQGMAMEKRAEIQEDIVEMEMQIQILKEALLKLMGLDEQSLNEFLQRINDDIQHFVSAFKNFMQSLGNFVQIFTALFG